MDHYCWKSELLCKFWLKDPISIINNIYEIVYDVYGKSNYVLVGISR
jgi:hypothetical protein